MIPLLDLRKQYADIRDELEDAIIGTLEKAQFILGPAVTDFESGFAQYCSSTEAVAVNSGTSSLILAMLAAGIGPGDEVIVPAMTFVATAMAVLQTGATPVLVDIEPDYYTMDPAAVEAKITHKTKAIVPVHLYGQFADMSRLVAIANERGLVIIEDAAQAHGAEYNGKRAGSFGLAGCFSFYPGKNLGACGEGGAVTTSDPALAAKLRSLRDWGQEGKYNHVMQGFNARMDGVQGAALGVKLKYIEKWTEARKIVAQKYTAGLGGLDWLKLPVERQGCRHVYHVYAVQVEDRKKLADHLQNNDIASGIHYPQPIHLLKCYEGRLGLTGDYPVSEELAKRELSLPICPYMDAGQIDQVIAAIKSFLNKGTSRYYILDKMFLRCQ